MPWKKMVVHIIALWIAHLTAITGSTFLTQSESSDSFEPETKLIASLHQSSLPSSTQESSLGNNPSQNILHVDITLETWANVKKQLEGWDQPTSIDAIIHHTFTDNVTQIIHEILNIKNKSGQNILQTLYASIDVPVDYGHIDGFLKKGVVFKHVTLLNLKRGHITHLCQHLLPTAVLLHTFDVSTNPTINENMATVAKGLGDNKTIIKLAMSFCAITHESLKTLAKALESHPTLADLDLHDNPLDAKAGETIEKILQKNGTLRSLNLERCGLQNEGVRCIARSLKGNETLHHLNIAENGVSSGARDLAGILLHNKGLHHIDIQRNDIGMDEGNLLYDMFKRNSFLIEIKIAGNKMPSYTEKDICTLSSERDPASKTKNHVKSKT